MRFINLKTRTQEAVLSQPSVLCIGNFDGVHIGHRQLVDSVLARYGELRERYPSLVSGAWFFDSSIYKAADEIYTIEQKLDVFASLGLDYAVIADFEEMKSLTPEAFVSEVLVGACSCVHAVCGENFRFGCRASGTPDILNELMHGESTVVSLFTDCDVIVSSTYIRELLRLGEIEKANRLLCNEYSLCEPVLHGKALGRKLGFPTVNQESVSKKLILKHGVYATVCTLGDKQYFGVTNVGVRPTVESTDRKNIETYMIGYDGDCYGERIKVSFVKRLRDEMKFSDIDALKVRVLADIEETKAFFGAD